MQMSQRCYTVKQVAELWQCSPRNIYLLIEKEELTCIRVGCGKGGIRIKPEHIETFESQNESVVSACKNLSQNLHSNGELTKQNTTSPGGKVVALNASQRGQMMRQRHDAS